MKNLELALKDSSSSEATEYFKMVLPPPGSPSWVNFKRRPHAYEDIMGASQEELDWDESDLGGTPPPPVETCEMIKVEERPVREPRVRSIQHQYEEVELGVGPESKEQSVKESWVEEEGGTGLPPGWQRLKDDSQREYYWHTPSERTQYSPPAGARKVCVWTLWKGRKHLSWRHSAKLCVVHFDDQFCLLWYDPQS